MASISSVICCFGREKFTPPMVQAMVDNFPECKFVSCGPVVATGDKQHPISVKKVALRDLPRESINIILRSPVDPKRTPIPSPSRPQPLASNGANGHLVYVRRKFETESVKFSNNDSESRKHGIELQKIADSSSESPALKKPRNDLTSETRLQSVNVPLQSEPQRLQDQHWKERFGKLQKFLKACDQSNLEEYIKRLRSVSPADRSKLAYQLEKRAIQLTLEEGKELHRVRVLNVLGKVLPDRHTAIPPQFRSHMEANIADCDSYPSVSEPYVNGKDLEAPDFTDEVLYMELLKE